MFEIRCIVEDKNLPKVMWALDGLVVGMPQTIPVRGAVAVKSNGHLVPRPDGKGNTIRDRVVQGILDMKSKGDGTITPSQIRELTTAAGGKGQSAYGITHHLGKEGFLKKKAKNLYTIQG